MMLLAWLIILLLNSSLSSADGDGQAHSLTEDNAAGALPNVGNSGAGAVTTDAANDLSDKEQTQIQRGCCSGTDSRCRNIRNEATCNIWRECSWTCGGDGDEDDVCGSESGKYVRGVISRTASSQGGCSSKASCCMNCIQTPNCVKWSFVGNETQQICVLHDNTAMEQDGERWSRSTSLPNPECGFEIPTITYGGCTIEKENECPTECSSPCEFVYDSSSCSTSCQVVVMFEAVVVSSNLEEVSEIAIIAELADILDISVLQLEVVGESETPEEWAVFRILIKIRVDGLATFLLFEKLVQVVESQAFEPDTPHLASLHSVTCTSGCEDSKYHQYIVIPLHRTTNLATLDDYDCSASVDHGINCLHEHEGLPKLRYHYDSDVQECVSFLYSGCGGHKNNFDSRTQCNLQCMDRPEKPSLSCTASLLMDLYGMTTSELQAHSPLSASVTQCRTEFHGGNAETQEHCYDEELYEQLCMGDERNFCLVEFTTTGRTWIDYICMAEGCNNPDDKATIIAGAINECSKFHGSCSVVMNCNEDEESVEFDSTLLRETYGIDCGSNPELLQSCPDPNRPCTFYDQCCSGMTCDFANDICLGVESFSASSTVRLESGDVKMLQDLQIGESVLSVDTVTGKLIFEEVYHIGHDHWITGSEREAKLLDISYGDGGSIELTPTHLLYLVPQDHNSKRDCFSVGNLQACSYMAKEVNAYSVLFAVGDGELKPFQVKHIRQTKGKYRGVHTRSGRVVVDGVVSSCYVKDHNYVHQSLEYVRKIHSWWPSLFHTHARTAGEFIDNLRSYYGVSAHGYWPAAFALVAVVATAVAAKKFQM